MRLWAFIIAIFVGTVLPTAAHAHPHEWIDLRETLVFDAGGRLTAIRQNWTFDAAYTVLSLPGFDADNDKTWSAGELSALAHTNIENLAEYGYFTQITAGGKPVPATVADVSADMQAGRIIMRFTLKFPPLDANDVTYRIFDPSYYVEMKHLQDADITTEGREGCAVAITRANPDAVYTRLAAALDKSAEAPDNLGENFADTVRVTCN